MIPTIFHGKNTEKIDRIRKPMLRDMWYSHMLQIPHKNFAKISLVRIRNQASQCLLCITMIIHVIFKNIMRQKGYSIDIYVAHVLLRMVGSVFIVPWIVKQKIQKTINSGHSR